MITADQDGGVGIGIRVAALPPPWFSAFPLMVSRRRLRQVPPAEWSAWTLGRADMRSDTEYEVDVTTDGFVGWALHRLRERIIQIDPVVTGWRVKVSHPNMEAHTVFHNVHLGVALASALLELHRRGIEP